MSADTVAMAVPALAGSFCVYTWVPLSHTVQPSSTSSFKFRLVRDGVPVKVNARRKPYVVALASGVRCVPTLATVSGVAALV